MEYFGISANELGVDSRIPVVRLGDSGEVFCELALEMIGAIRKAAA